MKLKRTALFSLYGIFHLVSLLQAKTACSSKDPICQCSNPIGKNGQEYRNVDCSGVNPRLTSLPNGIPKDVEKLDLTGNEIVDVPPKPEFKKLTKLENLTLSGNMITSIDDGDFTDLKALRVLDLSGNPITTITKDAFTGLTQLVTIDLVYVFLICGCVERDFYNWTTTYQPKSIEIKGGQCQNVQQQLRPLFLANIPFNSHIYSQCDQTKGEGLACSVCTCIQTEVNCNRGGKKLYEFPKEIPVKTKILDLASNNITSVPTDDLIKLVNLETLDLQKNDITAFNWTVFDDLPKLSGINLSDNPLQCGCSDKPFFERLKTESDLATRFIGNPTCKNYRANTHLKDMDLDASPFDKCGATTATTTAITTKPPSPSAPAARCMTCSKPSALYDNECAKGNIKKCDVGKDACKTEFKFTAAGFWSLEKLCSKHCTSQQQPEPCLGLNSDSEKNFYGIEGSCMMCCGSDVCNEQYAEIKSYLKTVTFKVKLNVKDAKNANAIEIQEAIAKVVKTAKPGGVIHRLEFKIAGSKGIGVVNATFLRGYMDHIQDSLKTAIKEGVDTDPVLKKEIEPEKIEIWTTDYCPPEQTIDDLKGNYSWPATIRSATSWVGCQHGGDGKQAKRKCVFGVSPSGEMIPVWDDPDLLACAYISQTTEALSTLTKIPITNGTVKAVSKQLASVSASAKNTADVAMSTEVVDNLVKSDAAFYKENVNITTKDMVTTISNLLNVDFNTMQGAGSARRLVASIEAMVKKIRLDSGQEMGVVENNLALTLVDTTTGKADNGLQYGVTAKPDYPEFNDTNVGLDKRGASIKTSIDLPPGVFKDKAIMKAAFVGYKSDMLFKLMELDTSTLVVGDSKKFNTTSNSMVLAAILDQPVSGLTGSDLIDMKFEHSEKELADNPRCVWWDQATNGGNGSWSTKGCTVVATEGGVSTCKCDHLTNFALLMDIYGSNSDMNASHQQALTIISITGCTLSAVALIFTIFTYVYFRRKLLKNNPSKILMNLCAALLGLNVVFLGGTHYQVDDGACKAVAVLLHYFLIAGFTWMGVEAFYMYLALIKVFQPYFSKLILKCCLVGWGLPLVIVVITIGVNKTENYYLKGGQICWIRDIPFYGAIVAPVCAILIINIIAFIMVVRQLHRLTLRKKLTKTDKAHTSTMTQLRGAVSVLILLGLTWLFAFLSIGDASLAFAYIFAILNTLQGLWIFVFYCLLKKDVQNAWMRKLICCPTPEDSRSSKDQLDDINKIMKMNAEGKYTLDPQNTKRNSKGTEGIRKQSDSSGVTLATYKRVSTDKEQPLALYTPVHLKSGMPGVSPCGPFPSTGDYDFNGRRKDSSSSTATTTTRISSAASTKSKKSIASNATVCTTLSSENDDSSKHETPTDTNCNTTSFENPTFSHSVSTDEAPVPTEQEPSDASASKEPTEEKNYKWEVKAQTGFVDSRGFSRPT